MLISVYSVLYIEFSCIQVNKRMYVHQYYVSGPYRYRNVFDKKISFFFFISFFKVLNQNKVLFCR